MTQEKDETIMCELLQALKECESDLWYQLEDKHGAEKAANHPTIIYAKKIISKATIRIHKKTIPCLITLNAYYSFL